MQGPSGKLLLFLSTGLLSNLVQGWRSECQIEGLEVVVALHGPPPVPESSETGKQCRVAFLSHSDLAAGPDLSSLDVVFTDSLWHVPFSGRAGPLFFIENVSAFPLPADLDLVMAQKTSLLSVLLPPPDAWRDQDRLIFEQAQALLPNDTYIDDGSLATHAAAFERYRFSLIAEDLDNRTVSSAFVHSLSFHTIPLFNGFTELGTMVTQAIGDFDDRSVNLPATLALVREHNQKAGVLWSYHRILQDQLQYRYKGAFEERLYSQACSVCRLRVDPWASEPSLAFVGIYSAKANFAKRQVIRETWGRVLREQYGLLYKFFLGEISDEATAENERARFELATYDDIVVLHVEEGYRMNSRKGLLFLEWIALHSSAEFLLKIDDDVYFRPAPLLEQLRQRPPAAYVWGFFDYISPVPREEGHPFSNSESQFPFDVFPPYPRGVVRVLSMDVVRRLADASRRGKLRLIFGDDPCLGVHLRQLMFDEDDPLPTLALDDRDSYRVFAMEPSCHPKLWSRITSKTWAVHHVSSEQIQCMWDVDVYAGYYHSDESGGIRFNESFELTSLPDLCSCASDTSFEERNDTDDIQSETLRVLADDEVP